MRREIQIEAIRLVRTNLKFFESAGVKNRDYSEMWRSATEVFCVLYYRDGGGCNGCPVRKHTRKGCFNIGDVCFWQNSLNYAYQVLDRAETKLCRKEE